MARHRVAVLGTGAMGGEIARWLERVRLGRARLEPARAESFEALLAASDIVVCALPLTSETEGILDARAFAAMPRGGYVINVARGAHVVEPDLIAAVRSGHLAGAALDVQCREPLPADDPLWSVPGITITPHIAAQSSIDTVAEQFIASVRAARSAASRCRTRSTGRAATEASLRRLAAALDALGMVQRLHAVDRVHRHRGSSVVAADLEQRRRARPARRARAPVERRRGPRHATPSIATIRSRAAGRRFGRAAGREPHDAQLAVDLDAVEPEPGAACCCARLPRARSSARIGFSRSTGTNMLPRIAGAARRAASPTSSEPTPTSSPRR